MMMSGCEAVLEYERVRRYAMSRRPVSRQNRGRIPSGPVGPFLPTSRGASLAQWLRADLGITLNVGNVSAWADQSGQGDANRNATQGTAANQPLYNTTDVNFNNQPTIQSQDSTRKLVAAIWNTSYTQPVTGYSVGRVPTDGGILCCGASGVGPEMFRQTGSIAAFAGAIINSGISYAATHVACAVFNGASSAIYVDDSQTAKVTGAGGANALDRMAVLAPTDSTGVANTIVAEVIWVIGADNASQRQQMFAYLGARYGVAVT